LDNLIFFGPKFSKILLFRKNYSKIPKNGNIHDKKNNIPVYRKNPLFVSLINCFAGIKNLIEI
jgi:hypothetical protein